MDSHRTQTSTETAALGSLTGAPRAGITGGGGTQGAPSSFPAVPASDLDALRATLREELAPFVRFAGPTFDTTTAADYLGVSVRSLETLVSAGEIRPVRPTPRTRRFLRETLDSYLRSRVRRRNNARQPRG